MPAPRYAPTLAPPTPDTLATLKEVVETLAPLERRAGSPAERQAAEWIVERLRKAGAEAWIEEEQFLDGYAPLMAGLTGAGAVAGAAALASRRARGPAAAVGAALTAAIADDISNGPRIARRLTQRPKTTWNVVAEAGDRQADRTLVVLAHHDAAPSGFIFDESGQHAFGKAFPGLLERIDTSLPLWWSVLAGPGLLAVGAKTGRRGLVTAGLAGCLGAAAGFGDIARSPIVPGANDNLSAVAVLVALAERLEGEPLAGVRVLLVSCGAEEVIQGGIYGFAARHFPSLDRERTWVLNLDTVGSPELVLIEGEGPVIMEDYPHRPFRDLVARMAEQTGAPIRRGMRARNSTDAVIPSRHGFPTATLATMDRYKALSNYHQMSDTPENLDYGTVAQTLDLSEGVARGLAPR